MQEQLLQTAEGIYALETDRNLKNEQVSNLKEEAQRLSQALEISLREASIQQQRISQLDNSLASANSLVATQQEQLGAANSSVGLLSQERLAVLGRVSQLEQALDLSAGRARLQAEQLIKAQAFAQALQTEEEISKAAIIKGRLIPLSNKYLRHLYEQAKKYQPKLSLQLNEPLPDGLSEEFVDQFAKDAYEKIKSKFDAVCQLKQDLSDTTSLPSERLAQFKESLQTVENGLRLHRDSGWKRYTSSCLAVLAILVTGILPAMIGWAAYSLYSGNKLPIFFNHYSRGDEYVSNCEKSLKL